MALDPTALASEISTAFQNAVFTGKDSKGQPVQVQMTKASADVWGSVLAPALIQILTTNMTVTVPPGTAVQVNTGTGTGATIAPTVAVVT